MAEDLVKHRIIAIGGSAGSLGVVLRIIADVQEPLGFTMIIILHRKNDSDSLLVNLISSRTQLQVREVEDQEPILLNTIYVAPADYHLLIENKQMFSLDTSEKVQYSRPSIDVGFGSIAETFGISVIGILLSGANSDGAEGLAAIRQAGGYTIVQNPDTAELNYMPRQALLLGKANKVADPGSIGPLLIKLMKA